MLVAAFRAESGQTGMGRLFLAAKEPENSASDSRNVVWNAGVSDNGAADITVSVNEAVNMTVSGNGAVEDTVSGNAFITIVPEGDAGIAAEPEADAEKDMQEDEYANLAIANVDNYVNVRSGPDTDSEIVGKMYDGAVAQILSKAGENEEWLRVVSGNVEGYIKAEYFIYGEAAAEVIDDYVTRYAQVCADRLNVRKEADILAERIGYVDNGESVKLLEDCGEWLRVQYTDSKEGYVAAEYVVIREEFVYAKSIEEERAEREAKKALEEREKESEQETPEQTAPEQQSDVRQTVQDETDASANGEGIVPPDTSYSDNDELRASIVEYAMQYLGNVYIHGGSSLEKGTDCSGFTCFIYADFGYSISRTPSGQYSSDGRSIDYSEIKPGDIICYTSSGNKCTHVGLYIGDGQIIHEANSRKGVIISAADYSTILGVKNIID